MYSIFLFVQEQVEYENLIKHGDWKIFCDKNHFLRDLKN